MKSSQQETNCEIPGKPESSVNIETNQISVVGSNDVRTNQVDPNSSKQQFTYNHVSFNLLKFIFLTI